MKRLAGVISRADGGVRNGNVTWGKGARDIHLCGVFASVAAGAKAATAMAADPDFAALRAESKNESASRWEEPDVWRGDFGEAKPSLPVMLHREYEIDRRHLRSAIALLPEVQATQPEMPALALVPVVSGDMARMLVDCCTPSLIEIGQGMDFAVASEAF